MSVSRTHVRSPRTACHETRGRAERTQCSAQRHDQDRIRGLAGGELEVIRRALEDLRPYERNPRKHPQRQIAKLVSSIREFGFLIPILVEAEGRIIAGHARVQAAKELGLAEVPTIAVDHLTEAQVRAFRIADNRLAELATWDEQALAIELKALSELDLSFDVEIMGFELGEIDILIERAEAGGDPDEADEIPELDEVTPPVSEVGDLWHLGEHRLLCADALLAESYQALLGGQRAQMVFTDPPYNVPINGHVCGSGKTRHAEFVMASGEMTGVGPSGRTAVRQRV